MEKKENFGKIEKNFLIKESDPVKWQEEKESVKKEIKKEKEIREGENDLTKRTYYYRELAERALDYGLVAETKELVEKIIEAQQVFHSEKIFHQKPEDLEKRINYDLVDIIKHFFYTIKEVKRGEIDKRLLIEQLPVLKYIFETGVRLWEASPDKSGEIVSFIKIFKYGKGGGLGSLSKYPLKEIYKEIGIELEPKDFGFDEKFLNFLKTEKIEGLENKYNKAYGYEETLTQEWLIKEISELLEETEKK